MNEIIFYETKEGKIRVEVRFEDETFWMTQKLMGELFGVESHTITYHLGEIFKSGELQEEATARKFRVVQKEGNRNINRSSSFYIPDTFIAEEELIEDSVVKDFLTTASSSKNYNFR